MDHKQAIAEVNKLRAALHKILEIEATNLEGWESDIHEIAREALGISLAEYFGTEE